MILFRRHEHAIQFGLRQEEQRVEIPVMALPDLFALEPALLDFARNVLHLQEPRLHERFVGRPHRAGWLYYLVEEARPPNGVTAAILWDVLPALMPRLDQQDRKALVLAVRFLGRG